MSLDYTPELILRLVGPLRLTLRDGVDVTPRALKAQGILALLGASPSLRRPRAMLQDKLWSDRTADKGSASLRTTVHRLRDAVGLDSDWLLSEPGWLGIDPTRVRVVLDPEAGDWEATGDPPEFCEGLDIADPEFEDWLRDQRMAFEDRIAECPPPPWPRPIAAPPPPRPTGAALLVAPVRAEDSVVGAIAEFLSTEVAMAVGRLGGAEVLLEDHATGTPPADATRLEVNAFRAGSKATIQARLSEGGSLLWSQNRSFPVAGSAHGSRSGLEAFIVEVTAAAAHHLGRGGCGEARSQIRAGYRALENLFMLDAATFDDCEQVFASTLEGPAANIHRAWRAQLRVISIIERISQEPDEVGREAVELIGGSMGADPLNPVVCAIASDVAMHVENNPEKAAHLARLAVQRDAYSPYARASSAQALAWLGKAPEAHLEAVRALRLAAALPNQGLWLIRCCVTAVRCGRFEEAVGYAQTAHDMAPTFRPPLRFLAALRLHLRDEAAAAEALRRLKVLEPDFSLDLMRREDYPVTSLRNTPLIEIASSGLI